MPNFIADLELSLSCIKMLYGENMKTIIKKSLFITGLFLALPYFSLHSGTCTFHQRVYSGGSGCVGGFDTNIISVSESSEGGCNLRCAAPCESNYKNFLCNYTR